MFDEMWGWRLNVKALKGGGPFDFVSSQFWPPCFRECPNSVVANHVPPSVGCAPWQKKKTKKSAQRSGDDLISVLRTLGDKVGRRPGLLVRYSIVAWQMSVGQNVMIQLIREYQELNDGHIEYRNSPPTALEFSRIVRSNRPVVF